MTSRPGLQTERESFARRPGNRLLAALPDDAFVLLEPDLRQLTLPQGVVCYSAGNPIDQVYFPSTGIKLFRFDLNARPICLVLCISLHNN